MRSGNKAGEQRANQGCKEFEFCIILFAALFVFLSKGVKQMYSNTSENLAPPRMMTPNQVAKTGVLSLYSIRKGIADGTIPHVKIGNNYRINYDKLLKMLEDC